MGRHLRDTAYDAVDAVRVDHGRWPLQRDDAMAWDAGEHAGWMGRTGHFHHTPDHLIGLQRENIWKGLGIHPCSLVWDAVMRCWMSDDGHRDALLDEGISRMGIGVHIVELHFRNRYHVVLVYRACGG